MHGLGCMGVCEGRGCFVHQDGDLSGLRGHLSGFGLASVSSLGFPQTFTL